MAKAAGIAARVQGLRRYYALLLCDDGKARLIKALDGDTVLAEAEFPWRQGSIHDFQLIRCPAIGSRAASMAQSSLT